MANYYVSPMGDPGVAGAVSNLASIFGSDRTRAKGELVGTQTRKLRAEADAREYQNQQVGALAKIFADNPQLAAVLGAGQGNSQQMAGAVGAFQEQEFRRRAAEAAAAGDFTGANAPLFGVANAPVAVNQIQSGYQLNPFQAGGAAAPTGKTLAEIVTQEASARQHDASAASSNASAGAAGALEALRRDQMANPEKYRTAGRGAGAPLNVSPQATVSLDKMVGQMAPNGAVFPNDLRNEVLTRASQLYQQNRNAQQSVADAFAELTETTPEVEGSVLNILPFTSGPVRNQPAKIGRKGAAPAQADPPPAQGAQAAPLPAASAMPPPQALQSLQEGKVTTFRNGQKWTLQNGQPKQVQ